MPFPSAGWTLKPSIGGRRTSQRAVEVKLSEPARQLSIRLHAIPPAATTQMPKANHGWSGFVVRAYQPAARRVYQPAALP